MTNVFPVVLLVNFHSSCNAGDAALLEASIAQLRTAFHEPRLIVSANYPQESFFEGLGVEVVSSPTSLVNKHRSYLMQLLTFLGLCSMSWIATSRLTYSLLKDHLPADWERMLQAYQQASLVVGCPGNQFFSMGRFGWPIMLSGLSVYLAHLFRKPFYVLPQSIGPFKRSWERRLIRRLYSQARLVFLREPLSWRLALELGLTPDRLYQIPDLAFGSTIPDDGEGIKFLESYGFERHIGAIGVTAVKRMVRSLDLVHFDDFYRVLAEALDYLVDNYQVQVVFFPQVTGPTPYEDDRSAARSIVRQMNCTRERIIEIEETLSPAKLRLLYSHMDIFVASRLHSGIFALSAGVPTLFIGYLTKTRGVLENLGMQEWGFELENLTTAAVVEKLESLWNQKEQLRSTLREAIPEVERATRQVGSLIAKDFFDE